MNLESRLRALHAELTHAGMDVRPVLVRPPASEEDVSALEGRLDCVLPPSFRNLLLNVSSEVAFSWFLPNGRQFEPPFHEIFSGRIHWSIAFAEQFELSRRNWVAEAFPDADDPYDRIWHGKLAFYEVGNGDYLGFDVAGPNPDRVVYLSHDDGEGHGFVLADDMFDLIERWLPLAVVGGEDWQWLPFTVDAESGLQPDGPEAARWRRTLQLSPS